MTIKSNLTTIVIVTANSGPDVARCVSLALESDSDVEVIVVDNASCEPNIQDLSALASKLARLRVVYNEQNIGFGPACNRGAALAQGDALMFLNPDCSICIDTVSMLRSVLLEEPDSGLVGALQIDELGKIDPASRRRDPFVDRAVGKMLGLSHLSRWSAFVPSIEIPLQAHMVPRAEVVDAVSGALMLIRRSTFEAIGGFDESYFLHFEDFDLCRRVRDYGQAVMCANEVLVVHSKGGSSRGRPVFIAWHKHRGMWRWFTKFDPAARSVTIRTIVAIGIVVSFLSSLVRVVVLQRRTATVSDRK